MEKKIIYTNQIQLAMQQMDFSLLLNVITPDGSIENQAVVYLSPQHAKSLVSVLAGHIKQYEEIFGIINIEPNADKILELQAKGQIKMPPGIEQ